MTDEFDTEWDEERETVCDRCRLLYWRALPECPTCKEGWS